MCLVAHLQVPSSSLRLDGAAFQRQHQPQPHEVRKFQHGLRGLRGQYLDTLDRGAVSGELPRIEPRPKAALDDGGEQGVLISNYSRDIDALAKRFRVIVPDLPGYGQSTKKPDHADPVRYLADMIRGLLDQLGIDTAHLVGNSLGCAAALRLALDTPDRVGKLVLMGPAGIGTTCGLPTAGMNSLLNYHTGSGPSRDKLATFIRTYLVYEGDSVPDELIERRYQASIDPEVVADPILRRPTSPRTLWRADLTRDGGLKNLRTPTLVLWGKNDKVNKPSGGPALLNILPNAELVMTAETGHWMQWERAELFNQLVRDFLTPTAAWARSQPGR